MNYPPKWRVFFTLMRTIQILSNPLLLLPLPKIILRQNGVVCLGFVWIREGIIQWVLLQIH